MLLHTLSAGRGPRLLLALFFAAFAGRAIVPAHAQGGAQPRTGDWPSHNLDGANSRFSTLDQIRRENADRLGLKWTFNVRASSPLGSQTPLVVDGVMYFNSGSTLYAVDASAGKAKWVTELQPSFEGVGRGPVYGDGTIYGVARAQMFAVDAKTGKPLESFGRNGVLPVVKEALDFTDPGKYPASFDPTTIGFQIQSSPAYFNGTVYLGLAQADSLINGGLIVALDAKTGRMKWAFRTIPQGPKDDGWELAKDTWSGSQRLGGGIWTQPAIDPALGLLYANVSNPSPNYDGSSRKGTNLFTNSIVALSLATGKLMWHYQAIHHDIWDWDLMTGPTLFDVAVNGKPVKALASLAKTCYVYMLDRESGQPIFPIVETPVPTLTDMPGEQAWPTQPIPYSARHVPQQPFCATYPEVTDPELAKRRRPSFHPYQVGEFLIMSPGLSGGPNRGSSSFSPRTGLLYVTGKNDAWSARVKPVGESLKPGLGSPGHYENIAETATTGMEKTQNIAAFNPATGDLVWVTKLAATTNGGNLVTAGDVLFQGVGRSFYALDATTGKILATVAGQQVLSTTPLTYLAGGRQYVAIVAGNMVLAYGLPD
jgi:quinoprotein glucose dehydrogenase